VAPIRRPSDLVNIGIGIGIYVGGGIQKTGLSAGSEYQPLYSSEIDKNPPALIRDTPLGHVVTD